MTAPVFRAILHHSGTSSQIAAQITGRAPGERADFDIADPIYQRRVLLHTEQGGVRGGRRRPAISLTSASPAPWAMQVSAANVPV